MLSKKKVKKAFLNKVLYLMVRHTNHALKGLDNAEYDIKVNILRDIYLDIFDETLGLTYTRKEIMAEINNQTIYNNSNAILKVIYEVLVDYWFLQVEDE